MLTSKAEPYVNTVAFLVSCWTLSNCCRRHTGIKRSSTVIRRNLLGCMVSLLEGVKQVLDSRSSWSPLWCWWRCKQKITVMARHTLRHLHYRFNTSTGRTSRRHGGHVMMQPHHWHWRFNTHRSRITNIVCHCLDGSWWEFPSICSMRGFPNIGTCWTRNKTNGRTTRSTSCGRYVEFRTRRRSLSNHRGFWIRWRVDGHVVWRLRRHEQETAGTGWRWQRMIWVTVDDNCELWNTFRCQQPNHFIMSSICYINSVNLNPIKNTIVIIIIIFLLIYILYITSVNYTETWCHAHCQRISNITEFQIMYFAKANAIIILLTVYYCSCY